VFLPYQTGVVGLQPYQLVLMGTVLEFTIFLFEVPTGIVADLVSRRLSVAIGLSTVGVAAILMASFPSLWPFAAAQVVWGIGETFISGASDAWVADEIPHGPRPTLPAASAFLAAQQGWMAGLVVGMLGSGFLGSVDLRLPFFVGGSALVLLGAAVQTVLPERGFHRAKDAERSTWTSLKRLAVEGIQLAKARVVFGLIIIVVFIHGVSSEGLDRLWTKHLEDLHLPSLGPLSSVWWWSIIGIASTLIAIGITSYVRSKASLLEPKAMFRVVGTLTMGVSALMLVFAFAGGFWWAMFAFLFLRGLRRTLDPLITGWINHHAESSVRATMLSFQGQAHGVGELIGGPTAAVIARVSTVPTALGASAAMLWPSLAVILRSKSLPEPEARPEPSAAS
jgi:MFS transporter, DHA3 family, tetracycline resistance protein